MMNKIKFLRLTPLAAVLIPAAGMTVCTLLYNSSFGTAGNTVSKTYMTAAYLLLLASGLAGLAVSLLGSYYYIRRETPIKACTVVGLILFPNMVLSIMYLYALLFFRQ